MEIYFTDVARDQEAIGYKIVSEKENIYTQNMVDSIRNHIKKMNQRGIKISGDEDSVFYRSVYNYWAHGVDIRECFYYDFFFKSTAEKQQYVTFRNRFWYVDYLNKRDQRYLLDDKYLLYQLIQPAFKREMIKLSSDDDYLNFVEFVCRHPVFVIKPIDLGSSLGVRKFDSTNLSKDEKKELFYNLLAEAARNKKNESWGRGRPSMVLEELIEQAPTMSVFHPASLQVLRITTVNDGNGNIKLFRPWIKIGAHNSFTAAAATDGLCAEIDKDTGVICSDGFVEDCSILTNHPDTGMQIKGYCIPDWNAAVSLCKRLAAKFPDLRYIGWDVALSAERGWCVVEANTQADFCIQMVTGRGIKKEFEEMIGWHPDKIYWWE